MPQVPVAVGVVFGRACVDERRVVGSAVVDHVIQYHPNPACSRSRDQGIQVSQAAILRFDVAVFLNGIAVVAVLAGVHRHQPQASDAQILQVVQSRDQPFEVSDAVAVAVLVAAHEDLHEGPGLPTFGQGQGAGAHRHRRGVNRGQDDGGRGGSTPDPPLLPPVPPAFPADADEPVEPPPQALSANTLHNNNRSRPSSGRVG